MVKEGLMKKLLVLSLVFACMTGNAQVSADSVVLTVLRLFRTMLLKS